MFAFALLFLAGCEKRVDDRLVVATMLPASEAAKVEAGFTKWLEAKGSSTSSARTPGIRWIWLDPGDDIEAFARTRRGVDVVLGGPAESFRRLESSKLLDRAKREFAQGSWTSGYERLVLASADGGLGKASEGPTPSDGAAILVSASQREAARTLAAFLVETQVARPSEPATEIALVEDGILDDLLRATLVDSAEELASARRALADLSDPAQSRHWMCEPPPWPPASVAKIQTRNGDQAMTMIETLAGQVAPDPRLASWLLRSWLTPARVVDGDLIARLARAEEGRLAREPRFRAWLRAEWTAWARQRYRRVARQARSGLPIAEAKAPSATPIKEIDTR